MFQPFPLEISKPMDVLVTFDTSNQMTSQDYDRVKIFLRNIGKSYDVGKDKARIGIINFGSRQKVVLNLNEGISEKQIDNAVQKITKMGKGGFSILQNLFLKNRLHACLGSAVDDRTRNL